MYWMMLVLLMEHYGRQCRCDKAASVFLNSLSVCLLGMPAYTALIVLIAEGDADVRNLAGHSVGCCHWCAGAGDAAEQVSFRQQTDTYPAVPAALASTLHTKGERGTAYNTSATRLADAVTADGVPSKAEVSPAGKCC